MELEHILYISEWNSFLLLFFEL